jgi:hypothetical protein
MFFIGTLQYSQILKNSTLIIFCQRKYREGIRLHIFRSVLDPGIALVSNNELASWDTL